MNKPTATDGFKLGFGGALGCLLALFVVFVICPLVLLVFLFVIAEDVPTPAPTPLGRVVTIGEDRGRVLNDQEWQELRARLDREREEKEKASAAAAEERQRIVREENIARARRLKEVDDRRIQWIRDLREREAELQRKAQRRQEEARAREAARLKQIEDAKYRRWTSSSGKHAREAKIISFAAGEVTLETRDGKRTQVPVEKLSDADREFIENWRESRR